MGEIDELNSFIGLLLTEHVPQPLETELIRIQHDLFDFGAALCMPGYDVFPEQAVERLDKWITELNSELPRLDEFILPGGSKAGAYAHVCRTVARRAERSLIDLIDEEDVPESLQLYINRLSDFLFVSARWIHLKTGVTDVQWEKGFNREEG